jgi:hypothetical protein
VAAGVAVAATLDASSILQTAEHLLQNETVREALAKRAADLGLADGVELAVQALDRLIGPPPARQTPPALRTPPAQRT